MVSYFFFLEMFTHCKLYGIGLHHRLTKKIHDVAEIYACRSCMRFCWNVYSFYCSVVSFLVFVVVLLWCMSNEHNEYVSGR